jgi:hypothetical protein
MVKIEESGKKENSMGIILTRNGCPNNQPKSDSNMPPIWGELYCNQMVK